MLTYKKKYTLKKRGGASQVSASWGSAGKGKGTMKSAGKGTMGKGTMGKGTINSAGKGKGKGTMNSAGKGKGKGIVGKGKGKGKGSRQVNENVLIPPPPVDRSLSCSHLIYHKLHNDEAERVYLKGLFNDDTTIKSMLHILTSDESEDITFDIDDTQTGVYLNWVRNEKKLVTVTIHTGMYSEGATAKMVDTCVKLGNAHIFFNKLNVIPKQIKITADDEIFITPVKLTRSDEANTIITKIVEILNNYAALKM